MSSWSTKQKYGYFSALFILITLVIVLWYVFMQIEAESVGMSNESILDSISRPPGRTITQAESEVISKSLQEPGTFPVPTHKEREGILESLMK